MGAFFNTAGMGNSLLGSVIDFGSNVYTAWYNNEKAKEREQLARQENYTYNERAAQNADARTRALYEDLYSPQAQMQQIKDAGLSPSIYASGGIAGKSGVSGAQGAGATGISPNVFGVQPTSALEAAQIALTRAQTDNLNENTITTEIENGIKKLNASTFANKWKILNNQSGIFFRNKETGNLTSLSDIANAAKDYNEFENAVLNNYGGNADVFLSSEEGRKTLREIYQANKNFGNDIAVLANSEENAKLMLQITNLLNKNGFAEESADAQIKQLRQISESAELTTEQKGAMNRLIDKMGHSTTADILLVLLMMLGQYSHANLSFGVSQSQQIKK